MKCFDCNTEFVLRFGDITINDYWVGPVTVSGIDYKECPVCGDRLYTLESSRKIDEAKKKKLDSLIAKLPIGDFVSIREARAILNNISRQAFHKNHRIKRGFIYAIKIDDRWFYNKKSVQQFHKTGDGRFQLESQGTQNKILYMMTNSNNDEVQKRFQKKSFKSANSALEAWTRRYSKETECFQ